MATGKGMRRILASIASNVPVQPAVVVGARWPQILADYRHAQDIGESFGPAVMASALYFSAEPWPLVLALDQWREGTWTALPSFIIQLVHYYSHMINQIGARKQDDA